MSLIVLSHIFMGMSHAKPLTMLAKVWSFCTLSGSLNAILSIATVSMSVSFIFFSDWAFLSFSSFSSSLIVCILSHLALTTVISGSYLLHACWMSLSREVLVTFSMLNDLPLYQETMSMSNFLKSRRSLTKNSMAPEISSSSMKKPFFLALWIFLIYHTNMNVQVFSVFLN